jgi:hypothetical protein
MLSMNSDLVRVSPVYPSEGNPHHFHEACGLAVFMSSDVNAKVLAALDVLRKQTAILRVDGPNSFDFSLVDSFSAICKVLCAVTRDIDRGTQVTVSIGPYPVDRPLFQCLAVRTNDGLICE